MLEPLLNFPGVYAIEHLGMRRRYVGSAMNIQARWTRHKRELRNGDHGNRPLQRAWRKYGEIAFRLIVLADLRHVVKEELAFALVEEETAQIAKCRNPYNRRGAGYARAPLTDEARANLSAKRKAMWADPEFRARRAASLAWAYTDPDVQARRGRAISAALAGPDAKAVKSTNARKMWADPEKRAHLSEKRRKMWADPEFRARQAATRAASWADPEIRARRTEGMKTAWARRKAAKAAP